MTVSLLVLAVLAGFAPERLADIFGGRVTAWEYVAHGTEAFALWAALGASAAGLAVRAICAYGAIEAGERAVCRLAFPMDRAPQIAVDQTLCDAATGLPISIVSGGAALFLAALVQEGGRYVTNDT
jgi:hypothetical protein